jgi:hypothetical protein
MTSTIVPVLWIIWGCVALVTALLYAYRSKLTRDEEGQIFLDEAFAHEKAVQTEIVTKVNKVQPAVHISLGLTIAMTIVVIAYYAWDALKTLLA